MLKNYLAINSDSIVENVLVWDESNGSINDWNSNFTFLDEETTPAIDWVYNIEKKDFELVENIGGAKIGYIWDGKNCKTLIPKPVIVPKQQQTNQPVNDGLQTL